MKNYNSPMQKWLDESDILMHSTHSEGNSVVDEGFTRTLKSKIYNKMTANNTKSDLSYLNELIDENNNTYRCFIGKKPVDADFSALTKETETNPKSRKFEAEYSIRITKYKNGFSKG